MDKENLKKLKSKILEETTTSKLYVWINENKEYNIKKIEFKGNLKDIFIESIDKIIQFLEEKNEDSINELDLENELQKYNYVSVSDVHEYDQIREKILNCSQTIQDLNSIEKKKTIRSFIIVFEYLLENTVKKIHLFQKISESQTFCRKKIFSLREGGIYEELTKEHLTLANSGDAIYIEEESKILVINKLRFESIFKFSEIHKEYAENFINGFSSTHIENFSCLKEKILKNKSYSKEVYKISKLQKYKNINLKNLETINKDLNYNLTIENNVWKIKETDDVKVILDILNRKIGRDPLVEEKEFFIVQSRENIKM